MVPARLMSNFGVSDGEFLHTVVINCMDSHWRWLRVFPDSGLLCLLEDVFGVDVALLTLKSSCLIL